MKHRKAGDPQYGANTESQNPSFSYEAVMSPNVSVRSKNDKMFQTFKLMTITLHMSLFPVLNWMPFG